MGSDTTSSSSSSTAATTSAEGDTGQPPIDLPPEDLDTGHGSSTGVAVGECETTLMVIEDAFLVTCTGACSEANFGATSQRGVGLGSHLLLRLPSSEDTALSVSVSVTVLAAPAALDAGFELTALAIVPPCTWVPGVRDSIPPIPGESGVTWSRCDAADPRTVWGGGGSSALDYVDPAWEAGSIVLGSGRVPAETATTVTLTLSRPSPGPVPESILLVASVPNAESLVVRASESRDPIDATVLYTCGQ